MDMARQTRRGFLARSAALSGGLFAFGALGRTPIALGATKCTRTAYQPFGTCRTRYGPPKCAGCSSVTNYSPNDSYYDVCSVCCPGLCNCTPTYNQAKSIVCNNSYCQCTSVS